MHRLAVAVAMLLAVVVSVGPLAVAQPSAPIAPPGETDPVIVIAGRVLISSGAAADALVRVYDAKSRWTDDPIAAARSESDGSYSVLFSVPAGTDIVVDAARSADTGDSKDKRLARVGSRQVDGLETHRLDFNLDTDPAFSRDPSEPTPTPTPTPSIPPIPTAEVTTDFGRPPSGEIPILFNDRHVYAKPDRVHSARVLAALVRGTTILVPLRTMFEQMGGTVSYDPASKTVDVSKPGSDVKVTVGKPEVVINGESRPLDVPPEIYRGAVIVPIRVIAESLGAYVQWVPDRHIVVVRYIPVAPPSPPPSPVPTPVPTPTPAATGTPAPARTTRGTINVYYATNRNVHVSSPEHYQYGDRLENGTLKYGAAQVVVPVDFKTPVDQSTRNLINALETDYYKDVRIWTVDQRGDARMLNGLTADDGPNHSMLLFVHGFNVSFEDGLKATAVLKRVSTYDGSVMLFSWPAEKLHNIDVIGTYDRNARMAGGSVDDLVTVLRKLAAERRLQRIHLLAHSMGNQVLLAALAKIQNGPDAVARQRYRKAYVAMVAADVGDSLFCTDVAAFGDFLRFANVVSVRDAALKLSFLRHFEHRVGEGSVRTKLFPTGAGFTLDASASKANPPWHGYLWDNPDLAQSVLKLYDAGSAGLTDSGIPGYYVFGAGGQHYAFPTSVPDAARCT